MHTPLFREGSADRGLVIFIHGFMGSPRQFDALASAVHAQGYAVAALLLPGHGVSSKEFSSGTSQAWLNHVYREMERYSHSYRNIYLVGHSMGGLLALNAAIKYGSCVRGVFLIACPFKLNGFSAYVLKVRLRQIFYRHSHPLKAAYLRSSSVPLSPHLIWHSAKPAVEMKKLMLRTREALPHLRLPVTAVYSSADEVVSTTSLSVLKSGLEQTSLECITLADSLHAYYPEHERSVIENALISFIGGLP